MKHVLAFASVVCLLGLGVAPAAAQTPARSLTIVNTNPTGEVQNLAEANEIRIVFSEPMVTLGKIPAVVRPPYVRIAPAVPGSFRWSGTTILIFTPDAKSPLPFATTLRGDDRRLGGGGQRTHAGGTVLVHVHDADGEVAAHRLLSPRRARRCAVRRDHALQSAGRSRDRRAAHHGGVRNSTSGRRRRSAPKRRSGWPRSIRRRSPASTPRSRRRAPPRRPPDRSCSRSPPTGTRSGIRPRANRSSSKQ